MGGGALGVAVLVVVKGGVAYPYCGDFVDVRVVDLDGIAAGDPPVELPDDEAYRYYAADAGLVEGRDVEFLKEDDDGES